MEDQVFAAKLSSACLMGFMYVRLKIWNMGMDMESSCRSYNAGPLEAYFAPGRALRALEHLYSDRYCTCQCSISKVSLNGSFINVLFVIIWRYPRGLGVLLRRRYAYL